MSAIGIVPAVPLLAGVAIALAFPIPATLLRSTLPALLSLALALWWWGAPRAVVWVLAAAFMLIGLVLASDARAHALYASLREVLDREYGGFSIDALGPAGPHAPIPLRAVLREDAAPEGDFVSMRAEAESIRLRDTWVAVGGGVRLSVSGATAARQMAEWRAGRRIETSVTFRRPARFLDRGVPDFERDLALDGTTLLASAKSGLLVVVIARGSALQEAASAIRAHVRRAIARWVGPHGPRDASIVAAVLIGDRTGLPDDVTTRLQEGGIYHVIAISGGNIAILAALVLGALAATGVRGRPAFAVAIACVLAYAQVVATGPSVWRATVMATLYFAARVIDHRSAAWQTTAVAAAGFAVVSPLALRTAGFLLTFGATVALLETTHRLRGWHARSRLFTALLTLLLASAAIEVALLPVAASQFSRVTSAGLVLNLMAVPAMTVVQVAGLVVVLSDGVRAIASPAGWLAHAAAWLLVESTRLVDVAPWLAARVPPPPAALIAIYYAALVAALATGRWWMRTAALSIVVLVGLAVVSGRSRFGDVNPVSGLRLTVFDVGQGDAMLLQLPGAHGGERSPPGEPVESLLVDTGGTPFGGGPDIGARVLAPALWALGLRRVGAVLITHGDPDHMGGAAAVLNDFRPAQLWTGVHVPRHLPGRDLLLQARSLGIPARERRRGEELLRPDLRIRVLHPPEPDWERQKVRNDDSVVLEIVYHDVALLLTGDIGADIEREILPRLTPARVRVLKVAHHGSRSSSSGALLDGWRPQIAIVSAGRGNRFGHPTADVLTRFAAVGARVYRTDRDGEVTLETDGASVRVHTYVEEARRSGRIMLPAS